eukprot:CAMPEP_0168829008 /NCGR_PEP_ID=MMETSP0727-20121128/801_1 /TAXON_ID=265536 /ORGANISM="Amphiprora sp., Strain CCMP467" /LENGTH=791 /DNA_ID=CAMNT_0008882209 /DNA_START=387 /DNA_END=2762 /DNA_ORIENTATION=-
MQQPPTNGQGPGPGVQYQQQQQQQQAYMQQAAPQQQQQRQQSLTGTTNYAPAPAQPQQVQQQQQQQHFPHQGLNGGWQSDKDYHDRRKMIAKIVHLLQQRKPNAPPEWLKKLPQMAKRLEESLYRSAKSFAEYNDAGTLKMRLQQLAVNIGMKTKKMQQQQAILQHQKTQTARPLQQQPQQQQHTKKTRQASNRSMAPHLLEQSLLEEEEDEEDDCHEHENEPDSTRTNRNSNNNRNSSNSNSNNNGCFNILDYGAVGDDSTINTKAIQEAMNDAHQYYLDHNHNHNDNDDDNHHHHQVIVHGRVVIPPGTFVTGNLVFQSGTELYFQRGATLAASTDRLSDYQSTTPRGWLALLRAVDQEYLLITGETLHGCIVDGRGRALAVAIDDLIRRGTIHDPDYTNRPSERQRPQNIEFVRCTHVRVTQLQLNHPAGWNQCYQHCRHVTIDNVVVRSDAYWNNDGIDIVDCRHVQIHHCDINCPDDGICLKSESPRSVHNDDDSDNNNDNDDNDDDDDDDDLLGVYNVSIRHCRIRSSASAIKLGTSSKVAFQHIRIEHVTVYDTVRSLLAIESVDGALIEHVTARHLVARNTGNPLLIRLGQRRGCDAPGTIRHVSVSHVVADVSRTAPDGAYDIRGPPGNDVYHNPLPCSIVGHPQDCRRIQDITLDHWDLTVPGRATRAMAHVPLWQLDNVPERLDGYPEYNLWGELPAYGLYVRHASGVTLRNWQCHLAHGATDFRPAFVLDDVDSATMGPNVRLPVEGWDDDGPQFALRQCPNVQLADDVDPQLVAYIDS